MQKRLEWLTDFESSKGWKVCKLHSIANYDYGDRHWSAEIEFQGSTKIFTFFLTEERTCQC